MDKFAWIDARGLGDLTAPVVEEAIHAGVTGVVADDPDLLRTLPPTVRRIVVLGQDEADRGVDDLLSHADLVLAQDGAEPSGLAAGSETGAALTVVDEDTLHRACAVAAQTSWALVDFRQDPSKIPLEILLAATDSAGGRLVAVVQDVDDAAVTLGVLERGSDGVLLAPRAVGDATKLVGLCAAPATELALDEFEIIGSAHLGPGERVCVDTCSLLGANEGILVGSYAVGMLLVSSETHPLPYMATRPFRVNAASVHSYALAPGNHTRYLAELGSGSEVLAVDVEGHARRVVVGRAKIETRPLLRIDARSRDGVETNIIAQDDWHVRLLAPDGSARNITDLAPGAVVLGHTLADQRHVGYPIHEMLREQ